MSRSRYHFRGAPEFVAAAAERLARPDLAGPAGRVEALAALANLCSQAVESEGDRAPAILRQAEAFRDQLRIASEAADAMLSAVSRACGAGPDPTTSTRAAADAGRGNRRRRPNRARMPDPDSV